MTLLHNVSFIEELRDMFECHQTIILACDEIFDMLHCACVERIIFDAMYTLYSIHHT